MANERSLYPYLLGRVAETGRASIPQGTVDFALTCNGYTYKDDGRPSEFDPVISQIIERQFEGQAVAFSGPNSRDPIYKGRDVGSHVLSEILSQDSVIKLIERTRLHDQDQAARIAFILGGIVRFQSRSNRHGVPFEELKSNVDFVSKMTLLGTPKSYDAIASSMAMYVISGGSIEEDRNFAGNVYKMGEAISEDPVDVLQTKDLGYSQLSRLTRFWGDYVPDLNEELLDFNMFPTTGAEFHFSVEAPYKYGNFWQRVAILNMS